jgi:hypothetical protein
MSTGFISEEVRQRIREAAGDRCGYCLSAQEYVWGTLEIEHIIPRALGGSDEELNLWLSCGMCNRHKGPQVEGLDPESGQPASLFNPRTQKWSEHFRWDAAGIQIIGLTAIGRATVAALKLNNELALIVRRNWVQAGWHPPKDFH